MEKARDFKIIVLTALLSVLNAAGVEFKLYKSDDAGKTWLFQSAHPHRINAVVAVGDTFLLGTDQGLLQRTSHSTTTSPVIELSSSRILSLSTDGTNTFAGSGDGKVWHSKYGLSNWTSFSTQGKVTALLSTSAETFAGTDAGLLHSTTNGGHTWITLTNGLPSNAQIFDLKASSTGSLYAALYRHGFWSLKDSHWTRLGDVRPLAIGLTTQGLFAGHNPGGVYRSLDAGNTWQQAQSSLPRYAPSWTFLTVGDRLFYGTTGRSGLFVTEDNATTWTAVAPEVFGNLPVVTLGADKSAIYAATGEVSRKASVNIGADEIFNFEKQQIP